MTVGTLIPILGDLLGGLKDYSAANTGLFYVEGMWRLGLRWWWWRPFYSSSTTFSASVASGGTAAASCVESCRNQHHHEWLMTMIILTSIWIHSAFHEAQGRLMMNEDDVKAVFSFKWYYLSKRSTLFVTPQKDLRFLYVSKTFMIILNFL